MNNPIWLIIRPKQHVTPETDPCRILKLVEKDIKRYYTEGWGDDTKKCCVLHAVSYRVTGDFRALAPRGEKQRNLNSSVVNSLSTAAVRSGFTFTSPSGVNDHLGKGATLKMIKTAKEEVCKK